METHQVGRTGAPTESQSASSCTRAMGYRKMKTPNGQGESALLPTDDCRMWNLHPCCDKCAEGNYAECRWGAMARDSRPVGEVETIDLDEDGGGASAWVRLEQEVQLGTKLYAAPTKEKAKPIETAPQDGTVFLGYRAGRWAEAYRIPREDCEMWSFGGSSGSMQVAPYLKPTHWLPLPDYPEE